MKSMLDSPEFEIRRQRECHFCTELDQLLQGLQTLHFRTLMKTHPLLLRQVFQVSQQIICADFIQDFSKVQYSPIGSNNRRIEERIMMNWINFLRDCEGKDLGNCKSISARKHEPHQYLSHKLLLNSGMNKCKRRRK